MHARKLNNDDGLIIYPCRLCHHLHLGHAMKQPTPQQNKKARLQRRIAETRNQLAQLRRAMQKLLAEEAKPTATDDANHSSGA
jgi:phage shock protein A